MLSFDKKGRIIFVIVCVILGAVLILWCFIKQEAHGTDFAMYYPLHEGTAEICAGDFIHTGEIYRIKFFGIDYIRIKCEDGCFDVRLNKTKT